MPRVEKIIRDPVHDVISFDLSDRLDALLFDLLNSAEFQRLRRVRQLGLAGAAYPGADHSRYSHSLGVLEMARKILAQLALHTPISPEERAAVLCAALLHDLGHGPFSHVFERVTGIHHEQLTRRIISDPASEVNRRLLRFDSSLPGRVIELFDNQRHRPFLHDMISSQLDADRMDYLLRDDLHTGSRYGAFDLQWVIRAMVVDPATQRLAVTLKGLSAVEGFLQARYHMYRNVYFHKVVRSGEGMLRLALQRARRLAIQGRLDWPTTDDGFYKALVGQRLTIAEFAMLDDTSVLASFKKWVASSEDATLAALCRGLLFRKLFKTVDISQEHEPDRIDRAIEAAAKAVSAAGGDPAYDLFYDQANDTPYEIFNADGAASGSEILVIDAGGTLRPFATMSPFVSVLNLQLLYRRIHVAAPYKPAVLEAVRGVIDERSLPR